MSVRLYAFLCIGALFLCAAPAWAAPGNRSSAASDEAIIGFPNLPGTATETSILATQSAVIPAATSTATAATATAHQATSTVSAATATTVAASSTAPAEVPLLPETISTTAATSTVAANAATATIAPAIPAKATATAAAPVGFPNVPETATGTSLLATQTAAMPLTVSTAISAAVAGQKSATETAYIPAKATAAVPSAKPVKPAAIPSRKTAKPAKTTVVKNEKATPKKPEKETPMPPVLTSASATATALVPAYEALPKATATAVVPRIAAATSTAGAPGSRTANIPAKPAEKTAVPPPQAPLPLPAPTEAAAMAPSPPAPQTPATATDVFAPAKEIVANEPTRYVVRTPPFRTPGEAATYANPLAQAGYHPVTRSVETDKGTYYYADLGVFLDVDNATALIMQIAQYGVQTFIETTGTAAPEGSSLAKKMDTLIPYYGEKRPDQVELLADSGPKRPEAQVARRLPDASEADQMALLREISPPGTRTAGTLQKTAPIETTPGSEPQVSQGTEGGPAEAGTPPVVKQQGSIFSVRSSQSLDNKLQDLAWQMRSEGFEVGMEKEDYETADGTLTGIFDTLDDAKDMQQELNGYGYPVRIILEKGKTERYFVYAAVKTTPEGATVSLDEAQGTAPTPQANFTPPANPSVDTLLNMTQKGGTPPQPASPGVLRKRGPAVL